MRLIAQDADVRRDMSELSLLNVENLSVGFISDGQSSSAVNGVSFHIKHGETVGLVGESGSGKSVSALSILKLLPYPTAFHESGKIYFDDVDLMAQPDHVLRSVRGNRISMIFQEPMSSLNPLHSIEKQISEIIELHQGLDRAAARAEALRLLTRVGIPNAEKRLKALPHELSGGQRQRVDDCHGLANQPDLLIADEPTTALDVTIQKQILDLLQELQSEFGMSILLITHDLGVVKKMADRMYVMQNGNIVEEGRLRRFLTRRIMIIPSNSSMPSQAARRRHWPRKIYWSRARNCAFGFPSKPGFCGVQVTM